MNFFIKIVCMFFAFLYTGQVLAVTISCGDEKKAIAHSDHKARRVSETILEVEINGIKKLFVDKNDDDNQFIAYKYCGRSNDYILIKEHSDTDSTQYLFNDRTGEKIIAGDDVIFSNDFKFYVAIFQEDGREGRNMNIYAIDGSSLWRSDEFLRTSVENSLESVATLSNVHWSSKNTLHAIATCSLYRKKFWKVTLQKINDEYLWTPIRKCQQRTQ